MLKTDQLYEALKNDEYRNYLDGTCLFNMCPENQTHLYNNRFFVIEGYDLNFPPRRLTGLMIWDSEKEVLHGPWMIKWTFSQPDLKDPHPAEHTIHEYEFITTETSHVELKISVRDKIHLDFCLSGFDDGEKLQIKKIPLEINLLTFNNN